MFSMFFFIYSPFAKILTFVVYAASRRVLEGGQYPVKLIDDSEVIIKNKVMSAKQLAKKEPEILKTAQQIMIEFPVIHALQKWSWLKQSTNEGT
jgi:hypothetical protein